MLAVTRAGALGFVSMTILLALPSTASAVINEAAAGFRALSSADLDGVRGQQGIRTNPGTVSGVSYVHQTQLDIGSSGASFVAVGTYNGQGTSGGSTNCPNDYDLDWNIYVDGVLDGVYFCDRVKQDAYTKNVSPSFRIVRGACIGHDGERWLMYFDGTLWRCLESGASGAVLAVAGIETLTDSGNDHNIDVKYTSLDVRFKATSTWESFNKNDKRADPNYSFTAVSSTAFNTYLSPLD